MDNAAHPKSNCGCYVNSRRFAFPACSVDDSNPREARYTSKWLGSMLPVNLFWSNPPSHLRMAKPASDYLVPLLSPDVRNSRLLPGGALVRF